MTWTSKFNVFIFLFNIEDETQKSDRSTPAAMLQTLGYEAFAPGGPTVKSLDDTTDSSVRASDREDLRARVREVRENIYSSILFS